MAKGVCINVVNLDVVPVMVFQLYINVCVFIVLNYMFGKIKCPNSVIQ